MKNEKCKHGYYRKAKESEPKQFLANNPWPYRGGRWRKFKNYDEQSFIICNHIKYETKNILIGGNTVYTGSDGIDYDINEENNSW